MEDQIEQMILHNAQILSSNPLHVRMDSSPWTYAFSLPLDIKAYRRHEPLRLALSFQVESGSISLLIRKTYKDILSAESMRSACAQIQRLTLDFLHPGTERVYLTVRKGPDRDASLVKFLNCQITPLSDIDATRMLDHYSLHEGALLLGTDPLHMRTPEQQWNYSLSIPIVDSLTRSAGGRWGLLVRGSVLKGAVGIGVTDSKGQRFLSDGEQVCSEGDFNARIHLRKRVKGAKLVIRNLSEQGASTFTLSEHQPWLQREAILPGVRAGNLDLAAPPSLWQRIFR